MRLFGSFLSAVLFGGKKPSVAKVVGYGRIDQGQPANDSRGWQRQMLRAGLEREPEQLVEQEAAVSQTWCSLWSARFAHGDLFGISAPAHAHAVCICSVPRFSRIICSLSTVLVVATEARGPTRLARQTVSKQLE